jgi:hypothetical protein
LERWSLKLQEFDFEIRYKKGEENLVADCLSRCVHSAALRACVVAPVWPTHAERQRELDEIPCVHCGMPGGHDNMAVCDGCDRCFHLRCLAPPR